MPFVLIPAALAAVTSCKYLPRTNGHGETDNGFVVANLTHRVWRFRNLTQHMQLRFRSHVQSLLLLHGNIHNNYLRSSGRLVVFEFAVLYYLSEVKVRATLLSSSCATERSQRSSIHQMATKPDNESLLGNQAQYSTARSRSSSPIPRNTVEDSRSGSSPKLCVTEEAAKQNESYWSN